MEEEKLFFYKGSENTLDKKENVSDIDPSEKIRDSFSKVLDGKNLSFLLGSGCSSFLIEDEDIGIPTMVPLAKDFFTNVLTYESKKWLQSTHRLDVSKGDFAKNIESFLSTLHSLNFFYESSNQEKEPVAKKIPLIINEARNFILKKCLNEANRESEKDKPLVELYKTFYRKLLYRNSNLQKPNIFTTNYDLYSEIALDKLGIHYVNGFSGGISKYFNPTIFNYALAEKMDLSQTKWSVIDNFIYLYKVHGSVNWIQDKKESKLFSVREIQDATYGRLSTEELIMVHPTPLKGKASMGSPYSDLFREFQKKLMQNNNVLVTIGYSFSDEHINNLIYQAFTIPSFRLIILGDPSDPHCPEINKLKSLDDPRVWIIGGELKGGTKLHYFKGFVEKVLPDLSNDDFDRKLENTLMELLRKDK